MNGLEGPEFFFFFFNTKNESTSPMNISGKKTGKSNPSLHRLLKHYGANTQHLASAGRKLESGGKLPAAHKLMPCRPPRLT